jgi:nucleolar protein 12
MTEGSSTQSTVDVKKRKLHTEKDVQDEGAPVLPRKKAKSVEVKSVKFAKNASTTKRETKVEIKTPAKEVKEKDKARKMKERGKGKAKEVNEDEDEDDEEENNSDLENAYLKSKTTKTKQVASTEAAAEKKATDEEEDSEGEGESTQIVHESIQPKPKPAKRQRFVPADETPEQRDRRTIFIGNLSSEVAHKRVCIFPPSI